MIIAAGGLQGPDYFILVGYFVLMLCIGLYFWRYMTNMREYFSGRNQIPWWLSGISYYMTSFSTFIFVASSELGHKYGFVAITLAWMVVPTTILGALVFSWRWRRARIESPVEYLEGRYGLGLRQTFGWANIPIRAIDNGLRLYATGFFVAGVVDLDLQTSIIVTAMITLAYTFAGGLWAVTVTDFVQFTVMLAGVLVLLVLALGRVGGIGGFIHGSPEGFFRLTVPPYTTTYLIAWFILLACNYNTSFALVQRYYCVRGEREARWTVLLVAGLAAVGPLLFFTPAMAARQFLPDADSRNIYAIMCQTLLPPGALGLIIAAMFSATMSTLSGEYNAMASVLTNDVYRRLINPAASDKRLVFIGRLMTVLLGIVPMGIALYVASGGGKELFRKMVTVFSITIAPIAVPMLAGLTWKRATNTGAIAGFLAGIGVGLPMFFIKQSEQFVEFFTGMGMGIGWFFGLSAETMLTFTTFMTTLVVMVIVSLLWPASSEELQRGESFAERMRTPVAASEVPVAGTAFSPWGAVGGAVAAASLLLLGVIPFIKWDAGAQTNLIIGFGLLLVGGLMFWRSRRSRHRAETVK